MMISLDKNSSTPLYIQVYDSFKNEISTSLKPGSKLPSIRKIATEYKISKNTVEAAYSQLYTEGYIESKQKSGYFVADSVFGQSSKTKHTQSIEAVENATVKYDFFPARLTDDLFPLKIWKRLFVAAMNEGVGMGAYGDAMGEIGLRREIARYLANYRGVVCDASQIIVCAGFADALTLLAPILKKNHQKIAVEHPGYHVVSATFGDFGFGIAKIAVEQSGISINELEKTDAKAVYVTPSHQFPMGVSMPIANRMRLLEWAKKRGGVIIEDDYDSELSYKNRPIPSLQGLDNNGNVIYVGTFSKALSPALRIGYIVLPSRYLEIYKTIAHYRFARVGTPMQKTLELFMAGGYWERHLRKVRTVSRKKHDLMLGLLKNESKDIFEVINDGGGLSILLRPIVKINLQKLKEECLREGLKIYISGDYCGKEFEAVSMGFGGFYEDEIPLAVEAFGYAVKAYLQKAL